MVLAPTAGAVAVGETRRRIPHRTPLPAPERAPTRAAEVGSQAVELALLVPAVVLVAAVVLLSGLLGADLVAAHSMARDAARHASVGDAAAAHTATAEAASPRDSELRLEPADPAEGDLVTARLRLRPSIAQPTGLDVWLPPAEATMRVEHR